MTSSLKVTETDVAAVHVVEEVVVLALVAEVVEVELVELVVELDPDPGPEIAMSAQ